jgi:hypothetical protein
MMLDSGRERAIRARLKDDFAYYAPRSLKIVTKPDQFGKRLIMPFRFNTAQKYVHKRIEEQRSAHGWVRAIVLKGRQQGVSTYTEGRFYWKTTNAQGEKTYILTHKQEATDNLFAMVERYHEHAPVHIKPHVTRSNAKELVFGNLDSRYQVATAGAKGSGRSATLINVHGSEVAFWENAQDHLAGMLQAVPLAPGTEVILESTANGVGNVFHQQWQLAESGQSDFIAIFVPWYWQEEYRRPVPDDFECNDDRESVPEGELTEAEYQSAFKLSDGQMYWRRRKIVELGAGEIGFWEFKKEYPATADEAFTASSSHSFLSRRSVLKARRSMVATEGRLIIGVDPGGDQEGNDRTAIIRRRTRRLFDPQTFTTLNTMQQVALIHRIIIHEKPVKVFIDVGGKGQGIIDRLFELKGTTGIVVPVNFGETAMDPERYVNRKAEMAWTLKEWIEDIGGANIPDSDEVQADFLASVADDDDSNQRKRLKGKKWLRSKGIRSPDIFDAACLTFAAPINDDWAVQGSVTVDFDPISGAIAPGGMGNSTVDFDPTRF